MVEYSLHLNLVFNSLADATRRDILRRVSKKELSVGEIAKHYKLGFAAISKHIKVLENARLISKTKRGKEHVISASPVVIKTAAEYLQNYESIWNERFNSLEQLLQQSTKKGT